MSIYNIVNLLKSYDDIHSVPYITKIMLTGIAIRNTGYYDNINDCYLKGLAHAKIIKKSVILFRVLNMTIWCKHVHRLELQIFIIFVLRIHQLG